MFTGIIEEIGTVHTLQKGAQSAVMQIKANKILSDLHVGDSIAVNGVCLTVTSFDDTTFCTDVMHETFDRSSLNMLRSKSVVNLERAMPANGRFGGHIVTGHIDGTGWITDVRKDDNAIWYTIRTTTAILRYIIEKGSIAIDGISLTVAKVTEESFCVSIIPHTLQNTILVLKHAGDIVNLENDCIGKYVEKLCGVSKHRSKITKDFLLKHGY